MERSRFSQNKCCKDSGTVQNATIDILGTPDDDDTELLTMMYEIIREERTRGRNMQHMNSAVYDEDST